MFGALNPYLLLNYAHLTGAIVFLANIFIN